jgi:hypothetical protein
MWWRAVAYAWGFLSTGTGSVRPAGFMAFRAGLAARIKWDGYRIIALKDADRVHLWTRPEPITPPAWIASELRWRAPDRRGGYRR